MTRDTSKENPASAETIKEKPESTRQHLEDLKKLISSNKLDEAVTKLVDIAAQNENIIPPETINQFIGLLDSKEKQNLKNFLEGHDERFRLKDMLNVLAKEVTGRTTEQTNTSPTSRIVKGIHDIVGKFTIGGKIGEIASKLGFGGETGKESNFLTNLFIGMAAKFTEQIAFTLGKNKKILNTALELRLASMNETDPMKIKNFKDAYWERAKVKTFAAFVPPTDPEDAASIVATPVKPKEGYDKESNTFAAKDTKKAEIPKKESATKTEEKPEKATT